ncbi:phosphoribosylglycinamide formyltransferase [Thiomicrorhabdus sp. zzn3]|uniref:phosphoribosylglycinamide formyltransferase n=1 Tax=Thiomicrorhabdus sp. zzn3 TaxID=3039775 RepID=UPI002436C05D|nr:phosphoribosylglycinamide formyltransferase [Thiomicrorhabdus sp. zzn3]MDG6777714.1 phosphoribosylglycinamide formyltransferase [Thiomicrorhabdus sp. zzn3]
MKHPLRIAVLISGNGSNLQAIIDHQQRHADLYEIVLVLSNRADAYGLQRAQNAGIECCVVEHQLYEDRVSFDSELQKQIDQRQVDLVVLAGFMRILSDGFTEHYLGRMLNIHPSLLPKHPGLNTHQKAIDAGDRYHGLSVHFVTPELDGGPVILQAKVAIEAQEGADTLQQKVHQKEHLAYPLVIQWFAEEKLRFKNGQAWYQNQPLNEPLQLESLPEEATVQ